MDGCKKVLEGCHTRVCPTKVLHGSVTQDCLTRMSHKSILDSRRMSQECHTLRLSYKIAPEEWWKRVSYKGMLDICCMSVLQDNDLCAQCLP